MKKATLFSVLLLLSISAHAQEHVIRFSSVTGINTPKGIGIEKFKELAEKYTNGKVKVEAYHSSSLFNDRESAKAIKEDKVEMLSPSLSQMDLFYDNINDNPWAVVDMPYLFKSSNDFNTLKEKGVLNKLNESLKKSPVFVIDIWDNGLRHLSTNTPINKFEDLSKLKPRMPFSQIVKAQFQSWGTYARFTDYGKLSTNTHYGIVDSSDNPASNFYNSKLMSSQKYFYKTSHAYLGYGVLVRRNFWEALPKDIQESLTKAMIDATKFQFDVAGRDNLFALEQIEASGLTRVIDIPKDVEAKMKEASKSIENVLSPVQKTALSDIRNALK